MKNCSFRLKYVGFSKSSECLCMVTCTSLFQNQVPVFDNAVAVLLNSHYSQEWKRTNVHNITRATTVSRSGATVERERENKFLPFTIIAAAVSPAEGANQCPLWFKWINTSSSSSYCACDVEATRCIHCDQIYQITSLSQLCCTFHFRLPLFVPYSPVNILYYLLLQYLSSTVVFLLVVIFRPSITSAPMANYSLLLLNNALLQVCLMAGADLERGFGGLQPPPPPPPPPKPWRPTVNSAQELKFIAVAVPWGFLGFPEITQNWRSRYDLNLPDRFIHI